MTKIQMTEMADGNYRCPTCRRISKVRSDKAMERITKRRNKWGLVVRAIRRHELCHTGGCPVFWADGTPGYNKRQPISHSATADISQLTNIFRF